MPTRKVNAPMSTKMRLMFSTRFRPVPPLLPPPPATPLLRICHQLNGDTVSIVLNSPTIPREKKPLTKCSNQEVGTCGGGCLKASISVTTLVTVSPIVPIGSDQRSKRGSAINPRTKMLSIQNQRVKATCAHLLLKTEPQCSREMRYVNLQV